MMQVAAMMVLVTVTAMLVVVMVTAMLVVVTAMCYSRMRQITAIQPIAITR